MRSLIRLVRGGEVEKTLTSARQSVESPLVAPAAEKVRVSYAVVDMVVFRKGASEGSPGGLPGAI